MYADGNIRSLEFGSDIPDNATKYQERRLIQNTQHADGSFSSTEETARRLHGNHSPAHFDNMQAMINTTFNAVGGSGVYEGPEGETCIIEAITTISSKTKALINQEALTEKKFEE